MLVVSSSSLQHHIALRHVQQRENTGRGTHTPGYNRILGCRILFIRILQCQEAFAVFDQNNKGLVATKELGNLLRVLGINPTNEELQAGKCSD